MGDGGLGVVVMANNMADFDQLASSHRSINIKVQELAKEQQRCHKEVSCDLGLPPGRKPGGQGVGGELRAEGSGGGELLQALSARSYNRPTVSSTGGSRSTISVRGRAWARRSSHCRWGSPCLCASYTSPCPTPLWGAPLPNLLGGHGWSQEVLAGTDLLYLGSHPYPPTLPQSRW